MKFNVTLLVMFGPGWHVFEKIKDLLNIGTCFSRLFKPTKSFYEIKCYCIISQCGTNLNMENLFKIEFNKTIILAMGKKSWAEKNIVATKWNIPVNNFARSYRVMP